MEVGATRVIKPSVMSIRLNEEKMAKLKAVQNHYSNKVTEPTYADLFEYMLDKELRELSDEGVDINALIAKASLNK